MRIFHVRYQKLRQKRKCPTHPWRSARGASSALPLQRETGGKISFKPFGVSSVNYSKGQFLTPLDYARSLPFGSKVRVTNNKNGQSVVVTITDRGPFVAGRVIDLTPAGARAWL
jgi:rare lipoprotein A